MANYLLLENGDRILLEDDSGLILLENQGGGGGAGVLAQPSTTGTLIGQPTLGSGGTTVGY